MLKKSKWFTYLTAAALCASLLVGCGGTDKKDSGKSGELQGTVTASGSTALLPLLKPAAEEFQKNNSKVTINLSGGGSFTGMNQVAAGAVNIGNSDVELPNDLKDKGLVDHKVAVAPFVFIVHPEVKVDNLTEQQVIDILTGKITNWKEVGGQDLKITLVHRAKSSGSRATIAATVLKGKEFTDDAVIQDSNGAVRAAISSTPGSIGYVDAAYVDKSVKAIAYNGVQYSIDAVTSGKYPVYTYTHMYTKGQPTGAVKAFIDFVLSPQVQDQYVEKTGFIPISKMKK